MTKFNSMTFQIVQVRYECGSLVEDTWPVMFEIAGQAIEFFNSRDVSTLFEYVSPDDDYFVRGLDRDYVATGEQYDL